MPPTYCCYDTMRTALRAKLDELCSLDSPHRSKHRALNILRTQFGPAVSGTPKIPPTNSARPDRIRRQDPCQGRAAGLMPHRLDRCSVGRHRRCGVGNPWHGG
jgi:hypothetical protein